MPHKRTGDDDGVDDGLPLGDVLALCEHEAEQADHQQRGYQEAEQPHQDDVGGDDEDDGDEALDLFLTVQEGLCLSGGLPDGEDQAADQQDACADVGENFGAGVAGHIGTCQLAGHIGHCRAQNGGEYTNDPITMHRVLPPVFQ